MLTAAVKTLSNATEEAVAQIAQGIIHILRKHLYSTKLNLTFIFHKIWDFSSKQKNFLFNITFHAQKIRENVVVDKKKCLCNI